MRIKAVLHDLQKFASKENEIFSLTRLNEIISSSQEDIEFLYSSHGIDLVMFFLESDSKLSNICLKILAKVSKTHEKIRHKLLEKNIFYLLAAKLKNETDFCSSNFVLYSALIVLLLQGSDEAQNQMRKSGCLSLVLHILQCVLNEADRKPLPLRSTELIIYSIIASNNEPRHIKNQTEVGWITPKILEFLGKQMFFSGSDKLQIIKCLWLLLKTALDGNELNQKIFLASSGLGVLFRSLQSIIEEENSKEMTDLMVKMTGVLVKFKSNKEFLYQASGYCPIFILGVLLKTPNTLIIQRIIIFLDSLTREFPQAIEKMRDKEILIRIKEAKMYLLQTKAPERCQTLWESVKTVDETQTIQQETCLSRKQQFSFNVPSQEKNLKKAAFKLHHLKKHCVVCGAGTKNLHKDFEPFFNNHSTLKVIESRRAETPKFRFTKVNIISHKKKLKEKERKFRKIISHSWRDVRNSCNIINSVGKRILQMFQNFLPFFNKGKINGGIEQ